MSRDSTRNPPPSGVGRFNYQLHISEGAQATESARRMVQVERFDYVVEQPLFKNCRHYQPGEIIRLDRETAARFIENQDIREAT